MCGGCIAPHNMGDMGDHSPVNQCPIVGHLGCSQSSATVNSTTMNIW